MKCYFKLAVFIAAVVAILCNLSFGETLNTTTSKNAKLASHKATFYDFEWDGMLSSYYGDAITNIDEQVRWTVGQLNGKSSVGRLDRVEISNIKQSWNTVTYHAKMVVAWGSSTVPSTYTLYLPRQTDYWGLTQFINQYTGTCIGSSDHDYTTSSAWYYYRPERSNCYLDSRDILEATATLTPNERTTTGKYPEYHKVWEDDTLRAVVIFGIANNSSNSNDIGYRNFNDFVYQVTSMLEPYDLVTIPVDMETNDSNINGPSPGITEAEMRGTLPDGKRVVINAFVIPGMQSAGNEFFDKYESLSAAADFIAYNGHSGFGNNIKMLANKGRWVQDQYVLVLMNGCITFAYIDPALASSHANVNPNDSTGDRYLDMITNANPASFNYMVRSSMAVINALMSYESPQNYEQILEKYHGSQVAVVSGEEDNQYTPQLEGENWAVTYESGSAGPQTWQHYGPFTVAEKGLIKVYTTGSNDADLYVSNGAQPTGRAYDCRSVSPTSHEQCVLSGSGSYYVSIFASDPYNITDFDLTVTVSEQKETDVSEEVIVKERAVVTNDNWTHFGPYNAASGRVKVEMISDNDADLYVRRGSQPTLDEFDCAPWGYLNETCNQDGPGLFYVSVYGYDFNPSNFELTITYTPSTGEYNETNVTRSSDNENTAAGHVPMQWLGHILLNH